jgi:RNA polymerase sigma-70 factor (ECF subfamily)
MDEKKLIYDSLQRQPRAQEALYKLYYGYGMGVALRYAHAAEVAAEIVNDSFMKFFSGSAKFELGKEFKPWFRQVIVNTAISRFRQERKHLFHTDAAEQAIPDEALLDSLAAEALIELLQQLPDMHRMVFNLYEIEGYSHKEIGEMLGMSEGTSRSHLSRAKAQLQSMITRSKKYERA